MAKRQKTKAFSFQGFDNAHYKATAAYTRAVNALFDKATSDIASSACRENYNPDKPFSFDDYPKAKAQLQTTIKGLAKKMQAVIELGSRKQWLFACQKNDEFIASIFDTTKLTKGRLKKMQDRNLDALQTFQQRKVGGMNLSERVWKYTEQYKEQIEIGLDVGLGEGRSAQQLSRDLRQNLQDPDQLFRRVRDKRGNLQLSKAAKAFHPGTGVYRSSYKNAMRLTRSEINMAYREADHLRWQQLEFVVGFEVHRSNHEPKCKCKLCERLVGKYPKWFKFKGWHPQCLCYATAILMDEEDFDNQELSDLKSALKGAEYKKLSAKNAVTDFPEEFKKWVEENAQKQAGWATTPYFIKDNFVDGDLTKGLKIALPTIQQVDVLAAHRSQIAEARANAAKWGLSVQLNMLELRVTNKDVSGIQSTLATIKSKVAQMEQMDAGVRVKCSKWGVNISILDEAMQTHDSRQILNAMSNLEKMCIATEGEYKEFMADATATIEKAKKHEIDVEKILGDVAIIANDKRKWIVVKDAYKKALQNLKDEINKKEGRTGNGVDKPHKGLKKSYKLDEELDETFKIINSEFTTEKWFEHGDLALTPTRKRGVNGFTYMDGRISLTPDRLERVKSALSKIGSGKPKDITFEEADAMATFWHEITHNRNVPGNMRTTSTQTDVMEMMNEFVARKTLPEFYEKLGCATTPHPEFITNRTSTGYNRRVQGYDFVISKLGLDSDKVLESAKKNLFTLKYSEQETTARQALLDGGLDTFKGANGKKIDKAQLNKIVAMCRKGESITNIEKYLKEQGIIESP